MAFLDENGLAEVWSQVREKDVKIELLWENASPDSEFAAQSISVDFSEFDFIAIQIKDLAMTRSESGRATTAYSAGQLQWFSLRDNNKSFALINSSFGLSSYFSLTGYSARKVAVGDNSLSFNDGFYTYAMNNTTIYFSTNNGVCIPILIYGIKGVSA